MNTTYDFHETQGGSVEDDWTILATRDAEAALEFWPEHLCAHCTDGVLLLAVGADTVLGYVPSSWFDSEGELLPQHRHENGEIKLPKMIDGERVQYFSEGMFLGGLEHVEGPIAVPDLSAVTIRQALEQLDWSSSYLAKVQLLLKDIAAPVRRVKGPRHTSVTTLVRKADHEQFIADISGALTKNGIFHWLTVRQGNGHSTITIERKELSASICIGLSRCGGIPFIDWHGAEGPLRYLGEVWQSVIQPNRRKATSYPSDLDGLITHLLTGLQAAQSGAAFADD